jgi:hypothetical protein
MKTKIPVDFIFNPNWWYRNYEIPFAEDFYLNKQVRANNDVSMRRALFERFGFGEPNPQPRPILGSIDVEELLAQVESADRIGLCCINMDYGTPDANVHAILEAAARAWERKA